MKQEVDRIVRQCREMCKFYVAVSRGVAKMQCPKCESTRIRKNGRPNGTQRYRCCDCGRQFMESPSASSDAVPVSSNGHKIPAVPDAVPVAVNLPPSELVSEQVTVASADTQSQALSEQGTAILLLDAENLNKFDANIEKFLSNLCTYPLQVKIAFANWKNTGGDTDLYDRGYQLLHVPTGKNSADAQMISVGAAISRHYPDAKEVFVCSSDWLLTHLCNELQSQGLTVYRVRKQDNNLAVENRRSGVKQHYSLSLKSEIPATEELIEQFSTLIKEEQNSINERIAKLSTIVSLFQERCNLTPNVNYARAQDAEQKPNSLQTPIESSPANLNADAAPITVLSATSINSLDELENVLIALISQLTVELKRDYVCVSEIKTRFQKQFKENIDLLVKKLHRNYTLIKLLKSRNRAFIIALLGNEHQVTIAQHEPIAIKSRSDLEQVLINIVNNLTKKSPKKQITIESLASEFYKQYGVTITAIMKHLKLNEKSFNEFVQSCSAFKLEKSGKVIHVALASA